MAARTTPVPADWLFEAANAGYLSMALYREIVMTVPVPLCEARPVARTPKTPRPKPTPTPTKPMPGKPKGGGGKGC